MKKICLLRSFEMEGRKGKTGEREGGKEERNDGVKGRCKGKILE